jgi:serine protease Do
MSQGKVRFRSMKSGLRILALVAATAVATSAVVVPVASTAQSPSAAPAPQLVAGLPDFTRLVEQVGPGVVSVEAEIGSRRTASNAPAPEEQEIPEIFRRFFGPGFPGMPGMPGPQGGPRGVSQGTGFIISEDGYVLTNHHVVDGADEIRITLSDRRELTARLVGSDEQSDVALLKVAASDLPALRIGDSDNLKPGQWVVAIGSPFGLDHSVTAGIVSAVGRANPYANQRYVPFIQTDVAINRGNSGGPLLDTRGQVVGINSQIFSNSGGYMGVSFAIPIGTAMSAVNQLKATGRVQRGMVGVTLQEVSPDIARAANLPDTRGALVTGVQPGGPGEKAGIRRGDVIRSVDGRQVNASSEVPPIIGAMAPGSRVTLGVLRDGRERDIAVTLAPLDESAAGATPSFEEPQRSAGPSASSNPLGLVGQDLDADDRRQLGLEPEEGVGIARVQGLAAREAGIQPGDVVLAVGSTTVGSVAALDRALAKVKAGDAVMLLVRRGNGTQYVAVTPRVDGEDK